MKSIAFVSLPLLCLAIATGACGDDEDNGNTGAGAGGSGGSPSDGGGGSGGTTSDGGGGSGGTGGEGGSGGCLDAAALDGVFSIDAPELCLVAKYTAPFEVGLDENFFTVTPTWGRHGGPLHLTQAYDGFTPQDEIQITRWQLPSGATGALTSLSSTGPFSIGAPAGDYVTSQAVDLPGSDWTLVGHSDGASVGTLVALDGTTVADSWDVVGYYGAAARAGSAEGRLLYTGKSALDEASPGDDGLYAADFCAGPALCNGGTSAVDSWGNASGAVTVDARGNVLATQTDYLAGDQELRGYHADDVAHGQTASVAGVPLLTTAGFGTALAAIAPTASAPGLALFQAQTFSTQVDYGDVQMARYSDSGGAIAASGTPETGLSGLAPATEVTLMNDDAGRAWVGVKTAPGQTTFFVLGRSE